MFGYGAGVDTSAISAAASAARASTAAGSARREVDQLEERIDRLALVCMAMWSLMQDKTRVTEEELMERVKAIDLMDGVEDRKATRTVAKCSKCSRTMSPRHRRCLYCGADKLVQSAFDAV
jgi:hypothetical protein